MKSSQKHLLAPASLALLLATPATGVELTALSGDWTLAELNTPSRLRESFRNTETMATRLGVNSQDTAKENEILVNATYPVPFSTAARNFSIGGDGLVSGDENGQIVSFSSNRLVFSDESGLNTLYTAVSGDVLLSSGRNIDEQWQTLCLKRPTNYATADAAGTWALVSMVNPRNISRGFFDSRLVDTFFVGQFDLFVGELNVAANGTYTGSFDGTITGNAGGDITLNTPDESIAFRINASKNILAATRGNADEREIILLAKKPASLATADLAGSWRISAIMIPTRLTEVFYNIVTETTRQADSSGIARANEILVDVFHPDPLAEPFAEPFAVNRLQLMVEPSGAFTGTEPGTLTANADRSVNLAIDGENITLHPNADKSVMIGGKTNAFTHELIIAVKTSGDLPANFEEMADFKTLPAEDGKLTFTWSGASNLRLEDSGSLDGWGEVTEAADSDSFTVDTTDGGSRFYRIAERPEEE